MDFDGVTTLQQEMRRQNLDATQYLPNGYDYNFLEENGDLFEGAYVLTNFVPFEVPDDEKPEGMVLYEQWIEEVDGTVGELSLGGWMAADMLVTGLRAAGPELSQQGVIDGLNQLTDYDFMGLERRHRLDRGARRGRPGGLLGVVADPGQQVRAGLRRTGHAVTCFDDSETEVPEDPEVTD